MKRSSSRLRTIALAFTALVVAACGGGGGGDSPAPPAPPDNRVRYAIGAANGSLEQAPFAIEENIPVVAAMASRSPQVAVVLPAHDYTFPSGPDAAGETLPKVTGTFDTLTGAYDGAVTSKLWLDLSAALGGYKVAIDVTGALASGPTGRGPSSGEMVVAPRETYADFAGRMRLRFNATATPVCLGWDGQSDGTFEAEQCMTFAKLETLSSAPEASWPVPPTVQAIAARLYRGWRWFAIQFDFTVGALQIVESNYDALAARPAASPLTLACTAGPGVSLPRSYALSWRDRNGSGRFDTGDDVRFELGGCVTLFDGDDAIANESWGIYELRGYERNVGGAPTFNLAVIERQAAGATILNTYGLTGGFTVRAPGITASTGTLAGYAFDASNLLAASRVAAKSMDFYPDPAFVASRVFARLRNDPAATDLGLCRNVGGQGVLTRSGTGPLAAGETAQVTFTNCDIGQGVAPGRFVTGTLAWTLAEVTQGPGTDWSVNSDARFDFTTATAAAALRRTGEAGMSVGFVLNHSFAVAFRPEPYNTGASLGGVLRGYEDGRLAYEIGCFAASRFGLAEALADYQLTPNHVVRTANKVMTIGMRQGESFVFKAHPTTGVYYADYALASLLGISAPECTALGVPASGVSGGETNVQFDTWPAGDADVVHLRLYNRAGTLLQDTPTSWAALMQ